MKILDCTLRDGGYYTQWDFADSVVDTYIHSTNLLPIDYLEVGYRHLPQKQYMGQYAYLPIDTLKRLRQLSTKKLAVMLDEKSTNLSSLEHSLSPIQGMVDMVRLAIAPTNLARAVPLAERIRKMGFEVGMNVMYMSKWLDKPDFLKSLNMVNDVANIFCMVDSFGGVLPNDFRRIVTAVKRHVTCPIGFHGHNNLHIALANALSAIEEGVEFIDSTICGMGRGAGNLETELLLTVLNQQGLDVDFNILGKVVETFHEMQKQYEWGTNLPYMISGANSIPQKEVMDWFCNRAYSFNSIIQALNNKRQPAKSDVHYPLLPEQERDKVLIIGGGITVVQSQKAILKYLSQNPDIVVIFATARHAGLLMNKLQNESFFCLSGDEAERLKAQLNGIPLPGTCILPPPPRPIEPDLDGFDKDKTFELPGITITDKYQHSCTVLALQLAKELKAKHIQFVGYDGYSGHVLTQKENILTSENHYIFSKFIEQEKTPIYTLTPSSYTDLTPESVYQHI